MKNTLVRGGAFVATSALAVSLAYAPTASAAVIPTPSGSDPSPAAVGAAYLAAQPGADHLISSPFADPDYGLTIDAGFALDAVGGQSAELSALTTAVEAHIGDYSSSSGQVAKIAAYLTNEARAGADINSLIATLEGDVGSNGRLTGGSTFTQTYAAEALRAVNSPKAASTRDALLDQQCSAGFFQFSFATTTCDAATSPAPDLDTTSLAVITLQNQKSDPRVAAAITKAVSWLATQQAADGSFIGYDSQFNQAPSANTTGLAGWAMGLQGRTDSAARAAAWLRARQLANAGSCIKFASKDNGAVVLDDLSVATASAGPLDADASDSATRATAQALPALLYAAGGAKSGDTTIAPVNAHRFVKAGSKQAIALTGAPGNTLCVTQGGTNTRVVLPASGSVVFPVTNPGVSGTTTISVVDAGGEIEKTSYDVLAEKDLRLKTAKRIDRGATAKITVKGLAPHERVRVLLGKKVVRRGHADGHGVFSRHYKVNHKVGLVKLTVLGQFGGLRSDAQKIRVVR